MAMQESENVNKRAPRKRSPPGHTAAVRHPQDAGQGTENQHHQGEAVHQHRPEQGAFDADEPHQEPQGRAQDSEGDGPLPDRQAAP
jgi:hypothetical protein